MLGMSGWESVPAPDGGAGAGGGAEGTGSGVGDRASGSGERERRAGERRAGEREIGRAGAESGAGAGKRVGCRNRAWEPEGWNRELKPAAGAERGAGRGGETGSRAEVESGVRCRNAGGWRRRMSGGDRFEREVSDSKAIPVACGRGANVRVACRRAEGHLAPGAFLRHPGAFLRHPVAFLRRDAQVCGREKGNERGSRNPFSLSPMQL